jgi:2-polyprenyl-6-methoxyphenol hydroxylase-like FAD-dependent oxidoreductase
MKKVLVCGGGIAGLSISKFLKQLFPSIEIHLFEKRKHILHDIDRGLGLWPNSINALKNLNEWDLDFSNNFHYIPAASYRNIQGTWLSSCSN